MTAVAASDDVESLKKILGTRLCAARRVSGLKQPQVAEIVGQKNMTQVSLWETGERLPKLTDLIMMARTYGVPLDFLCGLSDDPLADQQENNQGFLTHMISSAIQRQHLSWLKVTSQSVAATIKGHSQDRVDLMQAGQILKEAFKAYARMKELNPSFEDDVRGAAKLESEFGRLQALITTTSERIDRERRQCEIIEQEVAIAGGEFDRARQRDADKTVTQMMLDITG